VSDEKPKEGEVRTEEATQPNSVNSNASSLGTDIKLLLMDSENRTEDAKATDKDL